MLITSKDNKYIRLVNELKKKKYREKYGMFPAEGKRLIEDLTAASLMPHILLYAEDFSDIAFLEKISLSADHTFAVSRSLFGKICETQNDQGVLAVFPVFCPELDRYVPDENALLLILNGVSITSETSAPIYVRQADKVFITTVNGTENSGGEITLTSDDDGLNAAGGVDQSGLGGPWGRDTFSGSSDGTILISGGTLHITASADGIDANGSLEITGGAITICGPDQGDTATLDYDTSAVISGGTFIGTGASGMAQTFSASEQGVIAVNTGNLAAGTSVTLTDSQGNTLLSCEPALSFSAVILSSPDLISGETYTLTAGSASQELTAQ